MTNFTDRSMSISYGTFSITLDGFEDPFPVMRRVTEYFRRIAAQDATFGTSQTTSQNEAMRIVTETLRSEEFEVETSKEGLVILPRGTRTQAQTDMRNAAIADTVLNTPEDEPEMSPDAFLNAFKTPAAKPFTPPVQPKPREALVLSLPPEQPAGITAEKPLIDTQDPVKTSSFFSPLRIIRSTDLEAGANQNQEPDLGDVVNDPINTEPSLSFGVAIPETPTVGEIPSAPPMEEHPTSSKTDRAEFSASFRRLQLQMDADSNEDALLVANTN